MIFIIPGHICREFEVARNVMDIGKILANERVGGCVHFGANNTTSMVSVIPRPTELPRAPQANIHHIIRCSYHNHRGEEMAPWLARLTRVANLEDLSHGCPFKTNGFSNCDSARFVLHDRQYATGEPAPMHVIVLRQLPQPIAALMQQEARAQREANPSDDSTFFFTKAVNKTNVETFPPIAAVNIHTGELWLDSGMTLQVAAEGFDKCLMENLFVRLVACEVERTNTGVFPDYLAPEPGDEEDKELDAVLVGLSGQQL